jgi:outer membrane receptor protein involved in Fe transport
MKKTLNFVLLLFCVVCYSQTTVKGLITDNSGNPLPGANIFITGTTYGTTSDFDGMYNLKTDQSPPFQIVISYTGFENKTLEIKENNQIIDVEMRVSSQLDEIVVSASRTPERIMESPVTIERMDARAIKNTSSPSFYDGLENLKGVDVNTNSLTFKSVNTRGFASFGNTRFMQLVDGMDNSSPALNFAIGNLLGMSELDVKTVELLPGASSALYGANAFNGIMFMTSKNPFDEQGISVSIKGGITSQEAAGNNEFTDFNIRMAHAFSNKFAAKATLAYLEGTEWHATDYRNTNTSLGRGPELSSGTRETDRNYNGVNVYGDNASQNINEFAQLMQAAGLIPIGAAALVPSERVSRTGYNENDLMDYDVYSLKLGASLNYRPFGDDRLEVIWNSKVGTGTTQWLGGQKYAIKNFLLQQHKLEVKGENFFVRGYMTSENAGDSYNTLFAALNINRAWKSDRQWFGEYTGTYLQGALGGLNSDQAHALARQTAETGRFEPGSAEFVEAFDRITADPDLLTGAKFRDETKLYHADANYNFQDLIDFAEIQVGGSMRRYSLNSFGNIFTDADGPIDIDEFGIYTQAQKSFLEEDRLKATASIRYDKAQNFEGNFSPRVSLAYAVGENKNQNFRASFQTGFRNPTTQDQYIGLDVGAAILVGSAPDNLDKSVQYLNNDGSIQSLSIRDAYENSFVSGTNGTVAADIELVQPESVTAYEVGYRGFIPAGSSRLTVDLSVYLNQYEDFIANRDVETRGSDNVLKAVRVYTNTDEDISSHGASIGLNTKVFNGFDLSLNYTYAKFDFDQSADPSFEAGFNTPEHKLKLQFGKTDLFKNFGFNFNARWQDEFRWESNFVDGTIGERLVLDAQINLAVPSIKSVFKLGGANLTGQEYLSAPGVGAIGSQYYLSWTINN